MANTWLSQNHISRACCGKPGIDTYAKMLFSCIINLLLMGACVRRGLFKVFQPWDFCCCCCVSSFKVMQETGGRTKIFLYHGDFPGATLSVCFCNTCIDHQSLGLVFRIEKLRTVKAPST